MLIGSIGEDPPLMLKELSWTTGGSYLGSEISKLFNELKFYRLLKASAS